MARTMTGYRKPSRGELTRAGIASPEKAVLRAICDYLTLRHVFFIRVNAGTLLLGDNSGGGQRRAVRMAPAGTADLIAFPVVSGRPQPLAIEVKTKYGDLSADQAQWLAGRRLEGWHCIVARSTADVERALREVGAE